VEPGAKRRIAAVLPSPLERPHHGIANEVFCLCLAGRDRARVAVQPGELGRHRACEISALALGGWDGRHAT
jgi:hypothetical protein